VDGVFVQLDDRFAVFERVGVLAGFPRQFAFFSDRDKARAETICDGGTENESTDVDANNLVDLRATGRFTKQGNGLAEKCVVGENWGDVFKDDTGFRKIDDIGASRREVVLPKR
jgi:hypothetical protein